MANKAEKRVGKVMWMSRVNGQMGVDSGRMCGRIWGDRVWSMQHRACRKLESTQMRVGRRLLGASNIVAEVAVQRELGWRKLEERREEMKMLFGKSGRDGRESTGDDGDGETKRG